MGGFQKTLFRPIEPREVYICRSIEREWPSGEWIESEVEGGNAVNLGSTGFQVVPSSPPSLTERSETAGASLTIIGGTKYDKDRLALFFEQNPDYENIVTGAGRGVEADVNASLRIEPDPDLFGKSARKVNVEQVLSHDPTSPVLLVGTGERVKQAKAWLKRAKWPREVIELP